MNSMKTRIVRARIWIGVSFIVGLVLVFVFRMEPMGVLLIVGLFWLSYILGPFFPKGGGGGGGVDGGGNGGGGGG